MKKSTVSILLTLATGKFANADNLVEQTSKDNSAQCNCYLASGPDPGYFQYHRFWDFRDIPSADGNDFSQAPALLTADQNNGDEPVTSPFFNSAEFLEDWGILSGPADHKAAVPTVDSRQNIYISRNTTAGAESQTYLTFRVQRLQDFVSVCELTSQQTNILHSSIRGRFRVIPNNLDQASAPFSGIRTLDNETSGSSDSHPVDDGAVFGFFTYLSDIQESDIEILTSDNTSSIRYSNQPDYDYNTDEAVPGASTLALLPNGTVWTEWLDHRIDWFDGVSRWYINDQLVLEKTINVPTEPSGLILNLWSDGGSWSGNMSVGSQVTVGVQWIDMAFNVSGGIKKRDSTIEKRKDSPCHTGCNIDSVQKVGFPEVAFNSSSSAFSVIRSPGNTFWVTYSMVVLVGMFLLYT